MYKTRGYPSREKYTSIIIRTRAGELVAHVTCCKKGHSTNHTTLWWDAVEQDHLTHSDIICEDVGFLFSIAMFVSLLGVRFVGTRIDGMPHGRNELLAVRVKL